MYTLKKGHIRPITDQIFSLIYSVKSNKEIELLPILDYLWRSEPLIEAEFLKRGYDLYFSSFKKKKPINYSLKYRLDNYIIDRKVIGDYISYKLNSLDFDDPFFVTYINLLHYLAENHESTYLYMLGIGFPEIIREQLDYDDIVTV